MGFIKVAWTAVSGWFGANKLVASIMGGVALIALLLGIWNSIIAGAEKRGMQECVNAVQQSEIDTLRNTIKSLEADKARLQQEADRQQKLLEKRNADVAAVASQNRELMGALERLERNDETVRVWANDLIPTATRSLLLGLQDGSGGADDNSHETG